MNSEINIGLERNNSLGLENNFIEKNKLSYQISKYIENMILNNELRSGERINETQIAKQLGTSTTPVREALRELEVMGFVEIVPYSGCLVRRITNREIRQAYRVRALIESYAISEGIENISPVELEIMRNMLEHMRAAAGSNNVELYIKSDVEFHKVIIKSANSPLLERMWLMANVSQWTALTIGSTNKPLEFFADLHIPILQCLKDNDLNGARKNIESHFDICFELLCANINNK